MLVWFCGNFKRYMKQFFLEFPKRKIPLKAFSNFPKPFSEYFRFMWYCFLNFGCSIDETIRCFSEIQKFFNLENMYQWQNWRVSMGLSTDQLSLSLIKVNHVKQWVSISKTRTRGLGRDLGVAWSRSPCYVFYFIFSFFQRPMISRDLYHCFVFAYMGNEMQLSSFFRSSPQTICILFLSRQSNIGS